MHTWLNYILEANAGLLLFLLLYTLLLRNETQFTFRRVYLLTGMVLSLALPLITIPTQNPVIPSLSNTLPTEWLPVGEIPETVSSTTLDPWMLLTYAYAAIVGLLLFRLFYQIGRLVMWIRVHRTASKIVEFDNPSVFAFSFLNYVFISKAHPLTEEDKAKIIRHERVHIQRLHSIDIFLIELIRILFWFNPLLKQYKHELSIVHEFEADHTAVKPEEVDHYCNLLAKSAITSAGLTLANHFNSSLTLKRITMMKTIKTKIRKWKTWFILLFASLFFVGVSCQDQIIAEMETISETTTIAGDFPAHLKPEVERILREKPGIKLMYVEAESENAEKLKRISPNSILFMSVQHDTDLMGNTLSKRIEMIVQSDGSVADLADLSKTGDEVFLIVEKAASPIGGMSAFYDELGRNIKYPEEARSKGIEGKVFIELIIEPDGTTSGHKILKGIGLGCDEEALRVVSTAETRWNPARQRGVVVRQKYVVPIIFKLGESANQPHTTKINEEIIEISTKSQPASNDQVFLVVEKSASPVGGLDAFSKEINEKLRMPVEARRSGVSGKVFVELIIEPDGTTTGHKLLKGIGYGCDEEALRVVTSLTTKWEPAMQKGTAVRQKYVVPIIFLNETN
jgi:TonB family protein